MKEWDRNLNLIRELVLKDLKIRYSRPVLGFLWAFLSPFLIVLIFYVVFGLFLKVNIEDAPFILYLMSGVFPWIFFQDSILKSTTSLVDNRNLIKESGFPHYLIPVSIVLANLVNFLPSLIIMITSSLFILKGLPALIFILPFTLMAHLIIIAGLSIIFSILYVRLRDLKYILDAALLLIFYLTPVFYSVSSVRAAFSPLLFKIYMYNPLVCVLNLYRIMTLKGIYPFIRNNADISLVFSVPCIFGILVIGLAAYIYRRNRLIINDYLSY